MHEAHTLLSVRAESKGLAFDVEYDKSVPANFVGDASRIRQVLLNLFNNAIKFTDHGRVDVRVGYHKEATRLPLTISVRDTGRGIDVDEHDLVFSAFEQSDKMETRSEDGTGLGLAISRALVERMNGKIKLDSQLGQGSTFTVYLGLPATDAGPVAELFRSFDLVFCHKGETSWHRNQPRNTAQKQCALR